jgi:hypothetical protein
MTQGTFGLRNSGRQKGHRKAITAIEYSKLRPIGKVFRAALVLSMLSAAACTGSKVQGERTADRAGLGALQLVGDPFVHKAYFGGSGRRSDSLHVYLSGDGSPWIGRTRIANDPTPRNPVALRLMALDPNPRLYLGRPCYHGLINNTGCSPALWTSARYSETVVRSMAAALQGFIDRNGIDEVVLIGYSGGGVLGWLLAGRLPQVRTLVTIAANLDIDAWAARHRYTRLSDSLNPAERDPLPSRIAQLHLAGTRDTNVPPSLVRAALRSAGSKSRLWVLDADHRCCWESHWPRVLAALETLDPPR